MKKLDYSSVIYVYNVDKTKKNKYVFTQSAIGNPGFIIILCDSFANNLNEEFTLTIGETYAFEFIFSAIQDLLDMRTVNISNPQNDEVFTYYGGQWINKTISGATNKAFLNVGWFNDVSDSAQTNTSYYFPPSAGGAVYALVGTSFSILGSKNTVTIINSILSSNTCGVKNVSGETKSFLVRGKCTGRPTSTTWVSFGLNDSGGVQVRQARTNSWGIGNELLTLNFECVVDMANNDEIYLVGCMHSNAGDRFYLINIFLTVTEI